MKVYWVRDPAELAHRALAQLTAKLAGRDRLVAAVPSGRTPLGLYAELRGAHAAGRLDPAPLRLFALDEYLGLGPDDPESFAAYFRRELGEPLGLGAGQLRLLDGAAADPEAGIRAHEAAIEALGGLDLAIIGVGSNGHVAFNEPGSDWQSAGRTVTLEASTVASLAGRFAGRAPPARGVTMGLALLRRAQSVLLLADGESKAAALNRLLRGEESTDWPVTAFAGHPDLVVIATAGLRDRP